MKTFRRTYKTAGVFPTTALVLLALCLCEASPARAQWSQPDAGNNIHSTNSGNVGVGTANPVNGKLQVNKSVRIDDDSGATSGSDTFGAAPNLYIGTTLGGGQFQFNSGGGLDLWQFNSGWGRTITFARNGFVGIGTTSPANQFHVANPSSAVMMRVSGSGGALMYFQDTSAPANQRLYQWRSEGGVFRMALFNDAESGYVRQNILVANSSGNIGIGTATPHSMLEVVGGTFFGTVDGGNMTATDTTAMTQSVGGSISFAGKYDTAGDYAGFARILGVKENATSGNYGGALVFQTRANGGNQTEYMRVTSTGNVGIGTPSPGYKLDVNGNTNVTGALSTTGAITAGGAITGTTVNATYQDVAEWVPSSQKLTSGTVVVLDSDHTNQVLASTKPYDTKVAGVVSARPGISLGEGGDGKLLVATTGRVRVKVDATRAPIKVGDLLVTSDIVGVAMKSIPVSLGDTQIHRPGTIIGKALEPLDKGTGEILVLLSLQ